MHVVPPPLHCCAYGDDTKWAEWLLDHCADIESRDQDYGATPLTAAVIHRQKRVIPILVARGANTEGQLQRARNGLAGSYKEFFDREGYRDIVELLQLLGVEE
jgi:hypothetical protein